MILLHSNHLTVAVAFKCAEHQIREMNLPRKDEMYERFFKL